MHAAWQAEYLRCLGVSASPPDFAFLCRLINAHLNRVPFELASKYHYAGQLPEDSGSDLLIPPVDRFVRNLADYGMGGNCYFLNGNFGRLLRSLGFDAHLVRVRPGHAALMVRLEGQAYYVDVGYGAPLFTPIRLDETPCIRAFGEEIVITRLSRDAYEIDRRQGGASFVTKVIEWVPIELDDLREDILSSYRDDDGNLFMRRMTATIFRGERCYQLRNETLVIKTNQSREERVFADQKEWIRAVQDIFGIHPQVVTSALAFLAARGIHFWNDSRASHSADTENP